MTAMVASVDEDRRTGQTHLLAHREIEGQRAGAIGHALHIPGGVEVQVDAVHVEPHPRVVLDALERVHGTGGLVQERAGAVHVVVLLVLPRARGGVPPYRARVPVLLHLEAAHEDVFDDPEAFALLDLEHLELVPSPDVHEGELVSAHMHCRRYVRSQRHGDTPVRMCTRYASGDAPGNLTATQPN